MADNSSDSLFKSVVLAKDNKSELQQDDAKRWNRSEIENIDFTRWNIYFPYQFLLVERDDQGDYSKVPNWIFTLPFPPESISYQMPIASTLTTTLNGTIEENNGVPIRPIGFSGTLGVMPLRPHADIREHIPFLGSVFAGTINNGIRLANDFIAPTENIIDITKENLDANTSTGYYQMRLLKQFLEDFLSLKKTQEGQNKFLAFTMAKDEAIYLVSIQNCQFIKSQDSPLEYRYSMSMLAYRRITISGLSQPQANQYAPNPSSPSTLAKILTAIQKGRKILSDAVSTLEAVRGDIDAAVFEPLRQVALFVKQAMGLPLATADLAANVLNDCRIPMLEYLGLKTATEGMDAALDQKKKDIFDAGQKLSDLYNEKREITKSFNPAIIKTLEDINQDEAMAPFNNPSAYFDLFNKISVSALRLARLTVNKIHADTKKASQQTRLDFENSRESLIRVLADFEAAVSLGDTTYDATYGRPNIPVLRDATKEDFKIIYTLNDMITQLGFLSATRTTNEIQVRSVDLMSGLAAKSGIAFTKPVSKFSVPFPYGSTLEMLSYRYLGTPDRWLEIVSLNGLRAPYVDEHGFSLPLLTNGKDNSIVVGSITNLLVGQLVTLYSAETSRATRRIDAIRKLGDGEYELTLDGDADLDRYTVFNRANLHTFLPGTVNSQKLIYIPSPNEPGFQTLATKDIPGINEFDPLIEIGGIDLLLTEKNDIVVTPDGDNRWAIGLTNIIQSARLELSTPRGSIMDHPGYGFPIRVGTSIADVTANDIIGAIRDMFSKNPVFEVLQSAKVTMDAGNTYVTINGKIRGTSQFLPLTFNLPT